MIETLVLALILLSAFSSAVIAVLAIFALMKSQAMFRDVVTGALREVRTISQGLLELKGVPAHSVNPETFAPSGVSWDALQKAREEQERVEDMEKHAKLRESLEDLEQAKAYAAGRPPLEETDIDAAIDEIKARLAEKA